MKTAFIAALAATCAAGPSFAQGAIPVTADNFTRAETDLYFGTPVKQAGGTGRFFHYREPPAKSRHVPGA